MTTIRPADPDPVGTLQAAYAALDERISRAIAEHTHATASRRIAWQRQKRQPPAPTPIYLLPKPPAPEAPAERESRWIKVRTWAAG